MEMKFIKLQRAAWVCIALLVLLFPLESQAVTKKENDCPISIKGNLIFANGVPVTIEAGSGNGTSRILYGEKNCVLIDGREENDLSGYTVYGGAENEAVDETYIRMTGGNVKAIYGGGANGEVNGNTTVRLTGGMAGSVSGGGSSSAAIVWGKRNGIILSETESNKTGFDNLLLFSSGDYKLYGKVRLDMELLIHQGQKMLIEKDAILEIPEGCKLSNRGEIFNEGALNIYGEFENEGVTVSYRVSDEQAELTGYKQNASVYSLPEQICGKTLVRIGDGALAGLAGVEKIILPATVESIGEGAFRDSSDLVDVITAGKIKEVGSNAFWGTKWLERERKKNPVVVFGSILVDGTSASEEVTIPDGVTAIADRAFYGCTKLARIQFSDQIVQIGEYAFAGSGIEGLLLMGEIDQIEQGAFSNCKQLVQVSLPKTIQKIGYSAFESCPALKEIFLPEKVVEISPYSFYGCTEIQTIYYPEGADIGTSAFPDGATRVAYLLSGQGGLTVEKIYPSGDLDEITLPEQMGGYPVVGCSKAAYVQAEGMGIAVNHTCRYNEFHQCTFCYTRHLDGILHQYGVGIVCTICGSEKPSGEGRIQIADIKQGETIMPVVSSSTNGIIDVQIFYRKRDEPDSAYKKERPATPGIYMAKAVFAATASFQEVVAFAEFTIQKAEEPPQSPAPSASGQKPSVVKPPVEKELERVEIKRAESPSKKKLKVTWKKIKLAGGYTIQISLHKKFLKKGTETFIVNKKTFQKTISKLKRKKRYYIRIRVFVKMAGKTRNGAWSKVKYVKVK